MVEDKIIREQRIKIWELTEENKILKEENEYMKNKVLVAVKKYRKDVLGKDT